MKISRYVFAGALALMATTSLSRAQQLRDLSVEQNSVAQINIAAPSNMAISVSADRPDATYAAGEIIRLSVSTSEDAYVTVLDVGPSGTVTQLFPNAYQTDNRVFANRPVEIAGGATGARITASPPFGTELIKVIASNKPISVIADNQLQGSGAFRSLSGGVSSLMRDLQVVSNQAPTPDTKIVFANFGLYTIASRAPAGAGQTVVVIPGANQSTLPPPPPPPGATVIIPAAPNGSTMLPVTVPTVNSGLINIPPSQPFPLLVATDKSSYRMGERITLAVTSMQACNLTVLEVATTGQVRQLFPNQANPNGAIPAQGTAMIAGGPSPVALLVNGPAGTEQIVGICTTDPLPLSMQSMLPGADRSTLSRDLAVVATRPTGITAIAAATFAVTP